MTVSGWTIRMLSFQPDQMRETQTKRTRSRSLNLSLGRDRVGRVMMSSWCSGATFRAARPHRPVNADQNARASLRRMENMGGFPTTAANRKSYDLAADGVSSRDRPVASDDRDPGLATLANSTADLAMTHFMTHRRSYW